MKRTKDLDVRITFGGYLHLGQVHTAMAAAGFRDGDRVCIVRSADLEAPPAIETPVTAGVMGSVRAGQRRVLNHDPQSPFTIVRRDLGLPQYWRIRYDGPLGREAAFGEEYIARSSTIYVEKPQPAPPAAFQWWMCYSMAKGRGFRRVLARTAEEAQELANSEPGPYFSIVEPL